MPNNAAIYSKQLYAERHHLDAAFRSLTVVLVTAFAINMNISAA